MTTLEINYKLLQYSIGTDTPFLNDVLQWYSSGRNKNSQFNVSNGKAYFSIYDGDESNIIVWDLSINSLINQEPKLINWLSTLI